MDTDKSTVEEETRESGRSMTEQFAAWILSALLTWRRELGRLARLEESAHE